MLSSLLFIPLISYNFISYHNSDSSRLSYVTCNLEMTDYLALNEINYNDYLNDTEYIEYDSNTRRLTIKQFGSIGSGGYLSQAYYANSSNQQFKNSNIGYISNITNMSFTIDNFTDTAYNTMMQKGIYYIDIKLNSPTPNYVIQNSSHINFNYVYSCDFTLYLNGLKYTTSKDLYYTNTHTLTLGLNAYNASARVNNLYMNNQSLAPVDYYYAINCCKSAWYLDDYDYSQDINNAYTRGYNEGERVGYEQGYQEGTQDNPEYNFSWLKNAFSAINELFNIEIIPGLKLSYLIGIPLMLELVLFILRLLN